MKNMKQNRINKQFYQKLCCLFFICLFNFNVLPSFAINNFSEIAEFQEIESLPEALSFHQCVFVNNTYLYCFGGWDINEEETDNIWYTEVQKDKTLGKWKESEHKLPIKLVSHQCLTYNNYIYCIGGNYPEIDTVWYSEIHNDNSIGEWIQSSQSLLETRRHHRCFTSNGYIYCTGGYAGSRAYSNIWYTKNSSNGEIEAWKSTTNLPTATYGHQCISVNDYIYFIGGAYHTSTKVYDDVWYTKSLTDGNLDEWNETKEIPAKIALHDCFKTNGNLYCSGGYLINKTQINDIWYAQWDEHGRIKAWPSTTNLLPEKIRNHQILALNSFIYLCGGYPTTNKTYLSFILPDLRTHQNKDNWYITDKLELNLASEYELGYYYLIDDSSSTTVNSTNSYHATESLLTLTSDKAIEHGTHYFHFALADPNYKPKETYHFKFNNFLSQIEVSSDTHPNQNEWYTLKNCTININNLENGINILYDVDTHSDTIPYSSNSNSKLVEAEEDSFVIPGLTSGTHYVHLRAQDSTGTLAAENLTTHFRINIRDQNQTTPSSLPIVKELEINPLKVSKDGKLEIKATIGIE